MFAKEMGYSSGSFSFASAEKLVELLGVEPGHVTVFALINESSKGIKVILDKKMMESELLNFHPLKNDKTTTILRSDLLKFLELSGHNAEVMDLPKV